MSDKASKLSGRLSVLDFDMRLRRETRRLRDVMVWPHSHYSNCCYIEKHGYFLSVCLGVGGIRPERFSSFVRKGHLKPPVPNIPNPTRSQSTHSGAEAKNR